MSASLRIHLVTETFPPEVNGVSMTLSRLVGGLSRRGHDVTVIAPRRPDRSAGGSAPRLHLVPGLPIPRYPELRFGLPAFGSLRELWSRNRPAIVHVATEGPLGWSALRTARRLDIPVVTSYHTNFHAYGRHYGYGGLRRLVFAWLRYCHQHARLTFVPSEDLRQSLQAAGFRHLEILARGVDTALFSPAHRDDQLRASWGAGPDDLVALYVGRLAGEKNIDLTIRAWQAMREYLPTLRLVLVGDGPERRRLAAEHPTIHFAGLRLGEDLARHYASGDVFPFASVTETFGNVVTEAMASGLPLLAYDYAAPRRFIHDSVNGALAPYGDEAAFLARAKSLAQAPHTWPALGAQARATVLPQSWDAIVDGFDARLRAVVQDHASAPR